MSADRDRLQAGAEVLGTPITETQADTLLAYLALLQRWNQVYNLTAIRDPQQMLVQHLLDSLSVLAPLDRHRAGLGERPIRLLDVGSGGGLPGAVIAVLQPDVAVTCVDTVGKKATFIRQVGAELRLPNLQARHARVEELREPPYDVITARAFASLADLVRLTRSLLAPGACWMAMKGQHPQAEIDTLPVDVSVFHVEQLQVPHLDAERCLIWMRPATV
ncbi:16S rRNA (guanine(527)-N(7))-methyltransferase RsmG [Leptothrix discophora]|uniref:Ribosomal RNA small subunit methyltransferase G n=1 Tax=Leptothrix discophora TaxID=89 RepID=A0ABT9G5M8_LEPDI|nr:16S rRNA (guanine(527)-N(7))-methyltransferase RsmG [Leptothrix discophora]MDP4301759.1 16S rRNA (guanine(527)-N(7))-methyltransferase RsmG [Leptothrix discophora]